jgi:hypothetical protein
VEASSALQVGLNQLRQLVIGLPVCHPRLDMTVQLIKLSVTKVSPKLIAQNFSAAL